MKQKDKERGKKIVSVERLFSATRWNLTQPFFVIFGGSGKEADVIKAVYPVKYMYHYFLQRDRAGTGLGPSP